MEQRKKIITAMGLLVIGVALIVTTLFLGYFLTGKICNQYEAKEKQKQNEGLTYVIQHADDYNLTNNEAAAITQMWHKMD